MSRTLGLFYRTVTWVNSVELEFFRKKVTENLAFYENQVISWGKWISVSIIILLCTVKDAL